MCKWGSTEIIPKEILVHPYKRYANPKWIDNFGGIPVDSCIRDEIEHLITNGIITLGCCCGHHRSRYTTCLIHKDSINLAKEMGYEPYLYRPEVGFENRYEMILKTSIKRKLYYVIRYKLLPLRNRIIWKFKRQRNELS